MGQVPSVMGRGPQCHLAPARPSQALPGSSSPMASPSGSQAEPAHLHHCRAKAGPDLGRKVQQDPQAERPMSAKAPYTPTPNFSVLRCEMETPGPPLNPHTQEHRGSEGTGNCPRSRPWEEQSWDLNGGFPPATLWEILCQGFPIPGAQKPHTPTDAALGPTVCT